MTRRSAAALAALLALWPAGAAGGGALPATGGGQAEVVRARVLLVLTEEGAELTWDAAVESDAGGWALVLPLGDASAPSAPEVVSAEELDRVDGLTAPRWVPYSSGCGSGALGGAAPEDAVTSHLVEDLPAAAPPDSGSASTFSGAPGELLAALADDGYDTTGGSEIRDLEEGAFLVVRVPSGAATRAAITTRLTLGTDSPVLDLRLLTPRGEDAAPEMEVLLLVAAGGRMDVEGAPQGTMAPPATAPAVTGDIGEAYEEWLADRVALVGKGGPAALVEYAGPVRVGGAGRVVTRFSVVLPRASGATRLTLSPSARSASHRVRAIVSAGRLGPGPRPGGGEGPALALLLALLLGLLAFRRRPRRALAVLVLLAALAGTGCPSLGHFQGARSLPKGDHRWSVALAPARDIRHDLNKEAPSSEQTETPRALLPEVSWRYGWQSDTDVGVSLTLGGVKGQVRRQLLRQEAHRINLGAGLGVGAFIHPAYGGVCAPAPDGSGDDGCFSSLFWGGLLDVPLAISRQAGNLEVYLGVRGAWLVLEGGTTYEDPTGRFPDVEVDTSVRRVLIGLLMGAVVETGTMVLVPELQVMSSRNLAGDLIWYPMVGVSAASAE